MQLRSNIPLIAALYYKHTGETNRGHPRTRWKHEFLDESWWRKFYKPKIQLVKTNKNNSKKISYSEYDSELVMNVVGYEKHVIFFWMVEENYRIKSNCCDILFKYVEL